MAGPSMGKMAKAWANKNKRSRSLTEVMGLIAMKVVAWKCQKDNGKMRANRIPLLLGDSGIGKSTVLRGPFVKRLQELTGVPWVDKPWHAGTQGFEDNTGLPIIEERVIKNSKGPLVTTASPDTPSVKTGAAGARPGAERLAGHIQKVAAFAKSDVVPGAVWDPVNYTLGIIDELASASTQVQNQIRELIDGYLNGEKIDPNCFLVATSNPPDPRFVTVNAVDAAVENRLKVYVVVPTAEELLQIWSEIMPELIYKFLMMNRAFIDTLSPREWHGVAQDVQDVLDSGANVSTAISEASDELYETPEVEAALRSFVKFGEDEFYYPILGRDLLAASGDRNAAHLKLINRWFDADQRGFIGETNSDLVRALNHVKKGDDLNRTQAAENVFNFLELLAERDCIDMVKTSMESVFNGPIVNDISTRMGKSKALKQLSAAVQRFHATQEKMGNAVTAS